MLLTLAALLTRFQLSRAEPTMPSFTSAGKKITYERFDPPSKGKHPAIIYLHGADGLRMPFIRRVYDKHCRALADQGFVVLLVHYMDRTDGRGGDAVSNAIHFREWAQTIGDAVTFASTFPEVDKDRIGLSGMSLGAALAMSEAVYDPRVKAVVEYFGPLPEAVKPALTSKTAPVLILHGDRDPLVSVNEAYKAEKVFKEKGVAYEMKVYPGQGHGFIGPAERDAMDRELAFLTKYLKPARPPLAPTPE